MKVILEVPDELVRLLDVRAKQEDRSRAAVIRILLKDGMAPWSQAHQTDVETFCAVKKRSKGKG